MTIQEVQLDDEVLSLLIRLSEDWTAENSCCGYRLMTDRTSMGTGFFWQKKMTQL